MAQDYTADCYGGGHVGQTDLQSFKDNFAALLSAMSGATAPATYVAGTWWLDTTLDLLKVRNAANSAWIDVVNMSTGVIATDAVATLSIINLAVTAAKLANDAVETAKIKNSAVTNAKILDGTILEAKLGFSRFGTNSAGSNIVHYNDSQGSTPATVPTKVKELTLGLASTGIISLAFTLTSFGADTVHAQIYRNGSPVGTLRSISSGTGPQTFTESGGGWAEDDAVQIYAWSNSGGTTAYVSDMRLGFHSTIYATTVL